MVPEPHPLSPRLAAVVARLDQRIDWEKRRQRDEMRVDVGPARDLLDRAGAPDEGLRVLHVGGTKGKGSVALRLAEGLARAGRRVGVYGSPHVERITERVRIGREEVPDDDLALALERALELREQAEGEGTAGERASWFDLVTVAAVLVLARARVEWVVLEVGLGGRLDSTNALDGELAVITNIDLEHTEILGDTRVAIAGEKAGILRAGRPFVCGEPPSPERGSQEDAGTFLAQRAAQLGAPLTAVAPQPTVEGTNRALAAAALEVLGQAGELDREGRHLGAHLLAPLGDPAVWRLPGRAERFRYGNVPVVVDGAHVASSLGRVLGDLGDLEGLQGPCVAVLAVAQNKPSRSLLKALVGRVDRCICTSVASGFHVSAPDLAAQAEGLGLEALAVADPGSAVAEACALVPSGGWVLVTGSLYLAGAVRGVLTPLVEST